DLNAATVEDVTQFFKIYYAPNNAVLTLVGDFPAEAALAKVRKHFESIPSQPQPAGPDMTEPERRAERRKTVEDNFAQTPRLDIVYRMPAGNTPDFWVSDVMLDILAAGQSSRLYQKLVKDKEVAVSVFGGLWEHRGPSLGLFLINTRPGKDFA